MESTYPKYVDGVLICKFKRPLKTFVEFEGEIFPFDLIYGEHHVLLASGTLNNIDSGLLLIIMTRFTIICECSG